MRGSAPYPPCGTDPCPEIAVHSAFILELGYSYGSAIEIYGVSIVNDG